MTKEEQMFEDIKQRINMLCDYDPKQGLNEYTLMPQGFVDEEGEDEQQLQGQDPNAAGGMPDAGMDMGGGAPNAGMDMGGGAPDATPGMDANADAAPEGGMMPGMDAAADGQQTPEGLDPQPEMGGGMEGAADTEQPGDEVIDITDLTDKQDDIEKEVHEVGGKFDEVLKAIGSFEELIRANDEKLEDLKAEIERRNPTQIEKLGLQKEKSYPFNVSPDEYWQEKEATSNYSTEPDNNGKEQGQYVITAKDIDGETNWKAIADSLDDKGFLYNQTLDKLLKF